MHILLAAVYAYAYTTSCSIHACSLVSLLLSSATAGCSLVYFLRPPPAAIISITYCCIFSQQWCDDDGRALLCRHVFRLLLAWPSIFWDGPSNYSHASCRQQQQPSTLTSPHLLMQWFRKQQWSNGNSESCVTGGLSVAGGDFSFWWILFHPLLSSTPLEAFPRLFHPHLSGFSCLLRMVCSRGGKRI